MKLTRLYGNKAINVQDGRLQYFAKSGVIDVPEHLVRRVMEQGFSTRPFADVAVPTDAASTEAHPEPESPVASTSASAAPAAAPLPVQPSTAVNPLPTGHPQVTESNAIASKEQLRAAEDRLRKTTTS